MDDAPPDPPEADPDPQPKPGPGFWGAVGWLLVVTTLGVGLAVPVIVAGGREDGLAVVAAATGGQLLAALLVVGGRWGVRRGWRRLAVRRPRLLHVACVLGAVLPLVVLTSGIAAVAAAFWRRVGLPDELTGDPIGATAIAADVAGWPWPLAALAVLVPLAVVPAVWEELFDRGFLGRGLVARYGPVRGVLVTSLLFGLVHVHPVQAVYATALGVALHAVYLWGKSLLLPVLLHGCINGLAGVALLAGNRLAGGPAWLAEDAAPPGLLVAAAVPALAGLGWVARAGRVTWVLPEGREWWPGFVTAEPPPARLGAVAVGGRVGRRPVAAAAVGLAGFAGVLGLNLAGVL